MKLIQFFYVQFVLTLAELMFLSTESLERNSTVAKVWISVLDVNDNAPEFGQDVSCRNKF